MHFYKIDNVKKEWQRLKMGGPVNKSEQAEGSTGGQP